MPGSTDSGPHRFPATRHSLVDALGADDPATRVPAYETLIAVYWKPVYKYLRVTRRFGHEDAEDLTQDFFARAFERDTLVTYDPAKARFRTFLRVCLDRFAANWHKAQSRLKRGGGIRPVDLDVADLDASVSRDGALAIDPDRYFRDEAIRSLFEGAVAALRVEYEAAGKGTQLAVFLGYDVEPKGDERPRYDELAARFAIPVTQVTNYLSAARRAFRRIVLDRLRAVSASEAEFAAEAKELLGVEP